MIYIRDMNLRDVAQAAEIEREAFPPPWPPTNFKRELTSNWLTCYLVACKQLEHSITPAGEHSSSAGVAPPASKLGSLRSGLMRWLGAENVEPLTSQLILGFVGLWFMVDEAHLSYIAVRTAHRQHGIGERLLIAAIEASLERNAQFITLEVRASNEAAKGLYRKYGFEEVGIRRAYYTDNKEDAVLMTLQTINSPTFRASFHHLREAHASRWATTGPD